uniref:Cilia and flagella associated protein 144 n=1 Tax=Hucho hucho TaxID=62062 RepID=A0A4W5MU54_9TELE
MAATKQSKENDPADIVNQNAIHIETIKKENRSQKVYTLFSINPYKRLHILTNKPMTVLEKKPKPAFLRTIHMACLEPTKKYTHPQTESQEIGWISRPLIVSDRSDRRVNWSRQNSEITKYMDAAWRLKEHTEPRLELQPTRLN